ncbi:hypothetical protein GPROT1_00971 [Gammaproteobacteria bacterium]|nr:hypothetical protein GPROT1_00971 [Gammaproteobacteria bacterium]
MCVLRKPLHGLLMFLMLAYSVIASAESTGRFMYQSEGQDYPYTVKQTGDNYTYEFERNPGKEGKKIKAALHVLQSVYEDSSINPSYSETFMKESALCFVFDGNFHSYRACFLPNDYSPDNRDRFWGFVTQLPNARWLITFNLLPALLAIGLVFLYPRLRGRG